MKLNVHPWRVVKWDEFTETHPNCSIALDWYVYWQTRIQEDWMYWNFNHHEEVDRLATRATCSQVKLYIKQWIFDLFSCPEKPLDIFVNDCDEDTSLSYWLLKNYRKVIESKKRDEIIRIHRLIALEDDFDTTWGCLKMDLNWEVMRKIAWIFQDYTNAKVNCELLNMSTTKMEDIILSTCERISKHIIWESGLLNVDAKYEHIWWGDNWVMIIEKWPYARIALLNNWYKAFVALREWIDGKRAYSIWKLFPFVKFPLKSLYEELNKAEWISDPCDCWGGSNLIWWSPRKSWSNLLPSEIETIINNFLQKK